MILKLEIDEQRIDAITGALLANYDVLALPEEVAEYIADKAIKRVEALAADGESPELEEIAQALTGGPWARTFQNHMKTVIDIDRTYSKPIADALFFKCGVEATEREVAEDLANWALRLQAYSIGMHETAELEALAHRIAKAKKGAKHEGND